MALSDHVTLTITANTTTSPRAGFGIPLILSANASWPERVRTYTGIEGVAEDFASTSPEYLAAEAMFSQNPHPTTVKIGRAAGQPTQKYVVSIVSAAAGYLYEVDVVGEGVTADTVSYTSLGNLTFTAANSGDVATYTAHGMETGDGPFRVSAGGTGGTAADTNYWIIKLTANTFQLADTRAHALATTAIPFSDDVGGTLLRFANDVIIAQLVQGLNDITGKNYTAVHSTSGTDVATVTATTAGDWFSLAPTDLALLASIQTHTEPSPTLATDIAAIRAEDDTWYALYTLYNSEDVVTAAAAAIEPLKKIYVGDLPESLAATLANGGGDTGDDLQTSNYNRTASVYHSDPSSMLGAAWLGTRLPYEPGSATWKFAQPVGPAASNLTGTQTTNLVAKNINFLQTTAGVDIMREGVMVGGEFIDVIRDLDWLDDDLTKSVFECLARNPKVPFTNAGISLIESVIRGSLLRAVARGIIDSGFTVIAPLVADTSSADRAIRLLSGIKFTARLAGAIHKVTVTGVVTV